MGLFDMPFQLHKPSSTAGLRPASAVTTRSHGPSAGPAQPLCEISNLPGRKRTLVDAKIDMPLANYKERPKEPVPQPAGQPLAPAQQHPQQQPQAQVQAQVHQLVEEEPQEPIYSQKYYCDTYEYRHVTLPREVAHHKNYKEWVKSNKLFDVENVIKLGVRQSPGWVHYAWHRPEPWVLLFRRPLDHPLAIKARQQEEAERRAIAAERLKRARTEREMALQPADLNQLTLR